LIRYNYNRSVSPPAPFINVRILSRDGLRTSTSWPAQFDTGADRTVVPLPLIEELNATPDGEFPVMGLGGVKVQLPSFFLSVAVHDKTSIEVEAVASPDEPHILLGRDVLNHFRILLDGPGLVLEIN
jgi:hypothetical protein